MLCRGGFLALLVFIALSACSGAPTQGSLRIGLFSAWPGYAPLRLAYDLELLPRNEVRVVEYVNASQILQAFRNGAIDAGTITADEALTLVSQGHDLKIVLVLDVSAGGDAIIARPGIHSLAELKGKRIAVETTALGSFVLSRALDFAKLSVDDIEVVPVTFDEQESYFIRDKVDAVVTFEPVRTRLLKAGGKVLFDSRSIPDEIVDVLVVRTPEVHARREQIQNVVNTWYKSLAQVSAREKNVIQQMAERTGLSSEELLNSFELIKFPTREETSLLLDRSASPLLQNLNRLSSLMSSYGLIHSAPSISPLLEPSFVQRGL
jgi:NitT/TauT family transport system substrate-binding protein